MVCGGQCDGFELLIVGIDDLHLAEQETADAAVLALGAGGDGCRAFGGSDACQRGVVLVIHEVVAVTGEVEEGQIFRRRGTVAAWRGRVVLGETRILMTLHKPVEVAWNDGELESVQNVRQTFGIRRLEGIHELNRSLDVVTRGDEGHLHRMREQRMLSRLLRRRNVMRHGCRRVRNEGVTQNVGSGGGRRRV